MPNTSLPSQPGLLFVSSVVLHPSKLSHQDFRTWYEETHIQEVQATGGISHTQRYESLAFTNGNGHQYSEAGSGSSPPVPENKNFNYDFLTLYYMPDLSFRESAAFKSLAGQAVPSEELVQTIFKQAEFCTRFCEQVDEIDFAASTRTFRPAAFVITLGLTSSATSVDLRNYSFARLPGCRVVRKYAIREASVLKAFQREQIREPSLLMIFEFDDLPDITDVADKKDSSDGQVGLWKLRRSYDGSEGTLAPWRST